MIEFLNSHFHWFVLVAAIVAALFWGYRVEAKFAAEVAGHGRDLAAVGELADKHGAEVVGLRAGASKAAKELTVALAQLAEAEARNKRQFVAVQRIEAQRDIANESYHRAYASMGAAQDLMLREVGRLVSQIRTIRPFFAELVAHVENARIVLATDAAPEEWRAAALTALEALGRLASDATAGLAKTRVKSLEGLYEAYVAEHNEQDGLRSANYIERRIDELLTERNLYAVGVIRAPAQPVVVADVASVVGEDIQVLR